MSAIWEIRNAFLGNETFDFRRWPLTREGKGKQFKREKKKSQESFKTRVPFDLYSPKEMESDFTFSGQGNQSAAFRNPGFGGMSKPCNYTSRMKNY